jgi:hypothetical protein
MTIPVSASPGIGWFSEHDCRLDDFRALVGQRTDLAEYPLAETVEENVLIYGEDLTRQISTSEGRRQAQAELARALLDGPGIVVITGAFTDTSVIDRATAAFEMMIAEQKVGNSTAGDHFAKPGANDRIWGALDKLALRAPAVFADYYANDIIAVISEAWLGANTRSRPRSTWSTPAERPRSPIATTTSASCRTRPPSSTRPTYTGSLPP